MSCSADYYFGFWSSSADYYFVWNVHIGSPPHTTWYCVTRGTVMPYAAGTPCRMSPLN